MFGLDYAKIAVLVGCMLAGGFVMHKFDLGKIEHQKGLVTAEKLKNEKAVRDALEWGMNKQREYDDAAIQSARQYAEAESNRAASYERRLADIPAPTVLVRGCLTYEFVRQLDAAISYREASSLPLPTGKRNDACAPVDALAVARWLLGLIDTAQHNASQLTSLQAFIRSAQALR